MQSPTDMTAFCDVFKYNKKLSILSMVSRVDNTITGVPMPRNYHQPEDNYETITDKNHPEYIGSIIYTVLILLNLVKAINAA